MPRLGLTRVLNLFHGLQLTARFESYGAGSRWFRQVSRQLAVGRGIGVEERL
jgi:hypothetical protein